MSKNLLKKKNNPLKNQNMVLSLRKKPIIERESNITATKKERFLTGFLWNKRKKQS